MKPRLALSVMLDEHWALAARPLLESGRVQALEWSFDTGWGAPRPRWLDPLLGHFAGQGALYGHGVSYSLLSGAEQGHEAWLDSLRDEVDARPMRLVSEHMGFLKAPGFRRGPPLPVPWCPATVELGQERLARLRQAAGVPVGLENLAFAWGRRDLLDQGPFLGELLRGDDFLLLDLHNLWCQVHNFGIQASELLLRYPLDRARVVHVSGGSWAMPGPRPWRRDTHDNRLPDEVLGLLDLALRLCPRVEVVVLERLGESLAGREVELAEDFRRLEQVLA